MTDQEREALANAALHLDLAGRRLTHLPHARDAHEAADSARAALAAREEPQGDVEKAMHARMTPTHKYDVKERAYREGFADGFAAREDIEHTHMQSQEKVIDFGGPDGGRYWRVLSDHAVDDPDVRSAVIYARVTGSVGCTYNGAKVERVGGDTEQEPER